MAGGGSRLTFLLHASPEALLEPAVAALVPLVLVHHALPAKSGEGFGWSGREETTFPLPGLNQDPGHLVDLQPLCSNLSSQEFFC